MLPKQQMLAERDRQARERVEAERERSLVRTRDAADRWAVAEQIKADAPPRGTRAERLQRELTTEGRAGCCGAPLAADTEPSGKYTERHRRGLPSVGLPPSPACPAAVESNRLKDQHYKNRRRERAGE